MHSSISVQVVKETPCKHGFSQQKKTNNEKKTPNKLTPGKCTKNQKKAKVKQVIEISSSYIESIPSPHNNENNSFKSPTSDPAYKDKQDGLEEKVSRLESSVEVIINGLNKLTNIFASQSPFMTPVNTHTTIPLVQSQAQTPHESSIAKPTEAEDILAKLKTNANASSASKKTKIEGKKKNCSLKDETLKKRKEVIVTTTTKTFGDRQTLKTLLPRGLVDQQALFLEEMLLDESYYQYQFTAKPEVTNETRFKIVLDLVLNSYNTKKDELIKLAAANWKHLDEKHKRIVVS
ncbi:hypothetical protein E2542_SST14162 [Spatholobus suberectus]|nr:hypothetical protein E2542_SST14162 [Spatholobus suberectus]